MTTTFQSVQVGDQLPVLVKWETAETIRRANAQVSPSSVSERSGGKELHLHPMVLKSYVTELLEKGFPPYSITAPGSRLDLEPLAPVKPEDTISLSGKVVDKREESGHGLVECAVVVENHRGETVARTMAVMSLTEAT